MHARRPRGERGLEVHHGGKGVRLHHDVVQRVLRQVAAFRHDHRDRLAYVAELVFGERDLGTRVEDETGDRRRGNEQRTGAPVVAQVRGGVYRDDARAIARRRGVDARKAGVGMLAAQERDVQ